MFNTHNIFSSKAVKIFLVALFITGIGAIFFYCKSSTLCNLFSIKNNISSSQNSKNLTAYNLPLRNRAFIGRENAIEQIRQKLSISNIGIITQSITGAGGIGKTQLATEYAYRAISNKDYDSVLWVAAETQSSINDSYNIFANKLKINVHGFKPTRIRKIIHNEMLNRHSTPKILIVLDNVPSKDSIQAYLTELDKQWGTNNKPFILITSRNQNWEENSLILDIFSPAEANFFARKYLPDEKTENIAKLTKLLRYFPLALGQALGYIKQNTNIDDYIQLYTNEQQKYLDMLSEYSNPYTKTLWNIFSVTLKKLSPPAQEVLYTSAYLNPDNIQIELFDIMRTPEKENIVRELQNYSLITMKKNGDSFKIHRLLQEVIMLNTNKDYTWLEKTIQQSTRAANNFDKLNEYTWVRPKTWLSHITILSNYIQDTTAKAHLLDTYGSIAEHFGLYTLAEKLYLGSLKTNERFYQSSSHITLGETLNALGRIGWRLGNYEKAKKYCKRSLKVYDISYKNSPNHIAVANSLHTLGRIESRLGNYVDAISLYEKSLDIKRAHYKDNNHISLAGVLNNLGFAQCRLGHFEKANKISKQAVKIKKNHYKGVAHVELADVLNNCNYSAGAA